MVTCSASLARIENVGARQVHYREEQMAEYSNYQKKVINNYYDNKETIMLTKLQELVTELYLAEGKKKQDQLWKRAETAMTNLKIKSQLAQHLLEKRDPALLAQNVQNWLKSAGNK